MPYSGVTYEGGTDDDFIVEQCHHEHKTKKAARECGEAMSAARKTHDRTSDVENVKR